MATEVTLTKFKEDIAACRDYIAALDWANAKVRYACAVALMGGLQRQMSDAGTLQQWRDSLKEIREAIDAAEAATSQSTDRERRFVRTQTRHSP